MVVTSCSVFFFKKKLIVFGRLDWCFYWNLFLRVAIFETFGHVQVSQWQTAAMTTATKRTTLVTSFLLLGFYALCRPTSGNDHKVGAIALDTILLPSCLPTPLCLL